MRKRKSRVWEAAQEKMTNRDVLLNVGQLSNTTVPQSVQTKNSNMTVGSRPVLDVFKAPTADQTLD